VSHAREDALNFLFVTRGVKPVDGALQAFAAELGFPSRAVSWREELSATAVERAGGACPGGA